VCSSDLTNKGIPVFFNNLFHGFTGWLVINTNKFVANIIPVL
jgi:hypothetical protein